MKKLPSSAKAGKNIIADNNPKFGGPDFYLAFRKKAAPELNTYPFLRVWHAGCSRGEEVYSMAILLSEEGLYERCKIYVTDLDESLLKKMREGVFPLRLIQKYSDDYSKSGGQRSFSDYCKVKRKTVFFDPGLRRNILFSQYDLSTGRSFNEFNVILCGDTLPFSDKPLQEKIFKLFHESLCRFGYLGLGAKESMLYNPYQVYYEPVKNSSGLYKRIR